MRERERGCSWAKSDVESTALRVKVLIRFPRGESRESGERNFSPEKKGLTTVLEALRGSLEPPFLAVADRIAAKAR